jgi:UDP-2,3-diacylglucosamine pyrophosphatase LpxH
MEAIVTSDLHLTDNPSDEYRWSVFPQLVDLSNYYGSNELWILGDLTHMKDNHSSRLVNRIVETLHWTRKMSKINIVHILKGNHDGLDPNRPYFGFLDKFGWCNFYKEPRILECRRDRIIVLPHSKRLADDWRRVEMDDASHIFLHATFNGARAEVGIRLEGCNADMFDRTRALILSGDIHVPQRVGRVRYVGAPYPIRFGDHFQPRALVVSGRQLISERLNSIRKVVINIGPNISKPVVLKPNDQVKVQIHLRQSEYGDWQKWKRKALKLCEQRHAVLCGVQLSKEIEQSRKPQIIRSRSKSPQEALKAYCMKKSVDSKLKTLGLEMLEED